MAIADDIRINQNWGPDGYKFEVVKEKEALPFNITIFRDRIEPAEKKPKKWVVKDGRIQKVPQEGEPSSVYRDVQTDLMVKQEGGETIVLIDGAPLVYSRDVPTEFQKAIRATQKKLVSDMLAHFRTRNM